MDQIKGMDYYSKYFAEDEEGNLYIRRDFRDELKDLRGPRLKQLIYLFSEKNKDYNYIRTAGAFERGQLPKRVPIDYKLAQKVWEKTGGYCYYCGDLLPKDTNHLDEGGLCVSSSRNWHVDHYFPVCAGGTNHIDNLVPSCIRCNMKKGRKILR